MNNAAEAEMRSELPIESIDELRETRITLGCYRETHRLDRMLRVFHKALTLARKQGKDTAIVSSLVSLHDHKGALTVTWAGAPDTDLCDFVDTAWDDESEAVVQHLWKQER